MKKLGFLVMLVFFSITTLKAQVEIDKAKSKFIYNFTNFFEWPQSERTGDFIIGVLGSDQVYRELVNFTNGKKVIVQPIKVVRYKNLEEVDDCHVVYVSKFKSKDLGAIPAKTGQNTLIISDSMNGLENGAALNFVLMGNRLKYQFSGANAQKMGLKYSVRIKEMAAN